MERDTIQHVLDQLHALERRLDALERGRPAGDTPPLEERRLVDLIVDLTEARLAPLIARAAHVEGGGDGRRDGREDGGWRPFSNMQGQRGRGR